MTVSAPTRGTEGAATLEAANRVGAYLERVAYRGYDPFDVLSSPLFRLPALRSARLPRFAAQQVWRRLPLNLRPLLRVPLGYNPVTLALALQGHAYLAAAEPEKAEGHRARAEFLLQELDRLRSQAWSGACWGYDFDWESRYARFPAGTPTVVATGIVSNALFTAWERFGLEQAYTLCESACSFVIRDLNRSPGDGDTFCWSYSPLDTNCVLNATMKGARLCAQIFSVNGDSELRETAEATVRYVCERQLPGGSWPYSIGDARKWSDNFHTAYVLDCLDEYESRTGDSQLADAKLSGWRYYRTNFFTDDFVPKYFDTSLYPIDATACAQSILTLCRFGDAQSALRVARWTAEHMVQADGSVLYQRLRRRVNAISYIRWSAAAAFCGLSRAALASA